MARTVALLVALILSSRADASIISYVEEFTYTGDFGRGPVSNAPVKIVFTADSASVGPVFYAPTSTYIAGNLLLSSTVTVGGTNLGSFVNPTYLAAIAGNGQTSLLLVQADRGGVGVGQPLSVVNVAGSHADALTAGVGILTGTGGFSGVSFQTTLGTLTLIPTGPANPPATIRAEVVPEPTSLAMLGVGLAGAALVRKSRASRQGC